MRRKALNNHSTCPQRHNKTQGPSCARAHRPQTPLRPNATIEQILPVSGPSASSRRLGISRRTSLRTKSDPSCFSRKQTSNNRGPPPSRLTSTTKPSTGCFPKPFRANFSASGPRAWTRSPDESGCPSAACVRVCACACVRVCVCTRARASVCVCARARVCLYVRARAHVAVVAHAMKRCQITQLHSGVVRYHDRRLRRPGVRRERDTQREIQREREIGRERDRD